MLNAFIHCKQHTQTHTYIYIYIYIYLFAGIHTSDLSPIHQYFCLHSILIYNTIGPGRH